MKLGILALILSITFISLSNEEANWDYLRHNLKIKPTTKALRFKILAPLLSSIPIFLISKAILKKGLTNFFNCYDIDKNQGSWDTIDAKPKIQNRYNKCILISNIGAFITTILSCILTYAKVGKFILHREERNQLEAIIKDWPNNKASIPEQFHEIIGELAKKMKIVPSELDEIINRIKPTISLS